MGSGPRMIHQRRLFEALNEAKGSVMKTILFLAVTTMTCGSLYGQKFVKSEKPVWDERLRHKEVDDFVFRNDNSVWVYSRIQNLDQVLDLGGRTSKPFSHWRGANSPCKEIPMHLRESRGGTLYFVGAESGVDQLTVATSENFRRIAESRTMIFAGHDPQYSAEYTSLYGARFAWRYGERIKGEPPSIGIAAIYNLDSGKILSHGTFESSYELLQAAVCKPDQIVIRRLSNDGSKDVIELFELLPCQRQLESCKPFFQVFVEDSLGDGCVVALPGRDLVAVSLGSEVGLLDTTTGKWLTKIQVPNVVWSNARAQEICLFSPDGKWLAIATQDRDILVFETQGWSLAYRCTIDHEYAREFEQPKMIRWSKDSTKLGMATELDYSPTVITWRLPR